MQWKMGKRAIKVVGVLDAHAEKKASSLFQSTVIIEEISVQRMRILAKTKLVYVAVVRANEITKQEEDPTNEDQVVTVNKDQSRIEYPVQV